MEQLVWGQSEEGNQEAVEKAARALGAGGVIAYPTDTLYGFGADASNPDALQKIYELKERDPVKLLLVMVADMEMAGKYFVVTPGARALAEKFLPGALTLVLKRNPNAPQDFFPDAESIGMRIPNQPFCLALSRVFGKPITSTSVNKSGEPSITDPRLIAAAFGHGIGLVVDGGVLSNPPSTILDCTENAPRVIREGAIPSGQLGL